MKQKARIALRVFPFIMALSALVIVLQYSALSKVHAAEENTGEIKIHRAAANPPPWEVERQNLKEPPPQPANPTDQEVEEIIKAQPGGKEKLEKAKNKIKGEALRAAANPPPWEVEKQNLKEPPPQPKNPTDQEVEEIIKAQPGGKEKLEKAKKGEKPTGMEIDWRFPLSSLNPFRVAEAEAQGATFSVVLNPTPNEGLNWNSGLNLYKTLEVGSADVSYHGVLIEDDEHPRKRGYVRFYGHKGYANPDILPYVEFRVTMPQDGWYIIYLKGCDIFGCRVNLKTWNFTTRGFDLLYSFPPRTTGNWNVYPYTGYFSKGDHYLYWFLVPQNTPGTILFEASDVKIYSVP